eukprot:TRINITY_DN63459_c0_g1_i1.p1 TRINITY_DN63459_c0_g1~~TRINITY_DN63459_c0_g1_i1.p1  ORF type:complete len:376 (+),score=70.51 TRINITY_DN63459_c0_g1_i1:19-1146(+)
MSILRRRPALSWAALLAGTQLLNLSSFPPPAYSVAAKLGKKSTAKDVVDKYAPDRQLAGKVAVVTGGNSGIGLETVKALAFAGCKVVLASRSVDAGQQALEEQVRQPGLGAYSAPDAEVDVMQLDLADLSSVVAFAQNLIAELPRIDFLVLNAGCMALPSLQRTVDGFERQVGVNHFGHALLVRLLLPVLERQDFHSRIVTLSSTAHNMDKEFNVEDLNYNSRDYSPWGAYGQSKLANAMFARSLAQRLPADAKISSVSVHPGVIRTPLWRDTPAGNPLGGWLLDVLMADKTVPQGAATTLWACLAPRVAAPEFAGAYLADCGLGSLSSKGSDDALAERLWQATDKELDAALARRGLDALGRPKNDREDPSPGDA